MSPGSVFSLLTEQSSHLLCFSRSPRQFKCPTKVPGKFGLEFDSFISRWVVECQATGVQEGSFEPVVLPPPISRVTEEGVTDCRHMDPDLMGPAGLQGYLEQRIEWQGFDDLEPCSGLPGRSSVDRHPVPVSGITTYRGIDPPCPGA